MDGNNRDRSYFTPVVAGCAGAIAEGLVGAVFGEPSPSGYCVGGVAISAGFARGRAGAVIWSVADADVAAEAGAAAVAFACPRPLYPAVKSTMATIAMAPRPASSGNAP